MKKRDAGVMMVTADLNNRPVVVTGGAGFIGCNLVARLADDGYPVLIVDTLSRSGVEHNLAWLQSRYPKRISFLREDVCSPAAARAAAEAQAVFHFAAQVAVTTSLEDPQNDFRINLAGTLNILEALRRSGRAVPMIFASTNKVYGDLSDIELSLVDRMWVPVDRAIRRYGISERRSLNFHTPYGCSKGAADQYVLDYGRSFGVPTAVLRMSCIYGPRQMGTEDQGWVAHFLIKALASEPINLFGDGRQVRDILYIGDAVEAYLAVWRQISTVRGRAFNLGGGPANAISLLTLLDYIEHLIDGRVGREEFSPRPGDQRYFVSDTRLVQTMLGLPSPTPWREGVRRLYGWLADQRTSEETQASRAPLEMSQ